MNVFPFFVTAETLLEAPYDEETNENIYKHWQAVERLNVLRNAFKAVILIENLARNTAKTITSQF